MTRKKVEEQQSKNKIKNNKTKSQKEKKKFNPKNILTKRNITYFILLILDIAIIIYSARHNYANYVSINQEKSIFVGDSKDLLFGKNYITLITTIFFFVYTLLLNKALFHKKNTKKFIIFLLLLLLILNITLFFIFTKRVY